MDAGQHILHYRVLAPLGEGGMGQVFRAHDTRLDREVALKVLSPRLLGEDEAHARFLREARLASQLDHPNICPVHAVEEDADGNLVIVMALVEGRGLDEILQAGPLEGSEVVSLATQLAEALSAAHERGIIHRDLKPANLRVGSDGRLRVLDFGLARQAGGETLTQEGTSLGSPAWMSPEQVRGEAADERADLWAWGAITTAMATGQAPFLRDSIHSMLFAIVQEEPPATAWVAGIPAGVRELADACLRKDPAGRPASAAALLEGIRGGDAQATRVVAAGGDRTMVARPTAMRVRRRGRWAAAGIGVAAIALMLAGWWLRTPAEPTRVALAAPQLAAGLDPVPGGMATLRYALEQEILDREGLLPVTLPDSLDASAGTGARAAAAGAVQLVEVELSPEGQDWRVTLRQRRVGDPAVVWSTAFLASPHEPLELEAALRGHMDEAFPGHPRRGDRPALQVDPAVYARLQQLRAQWSTTGGKRETEALLAAVDSLVALAPRHPGPARFGLEVSSYLLMNDLRPDARALVEGYARSALDIDGSDPRSWRQLFGARLDDGDIEGAREALAGLSGVARSRAERRFAEGLLRYAEGDREAGLARMEEATRRLPSLAHYNVLADHYYRDDRLEEARATLEELLSLHPGYGPARSKLAQIELLEGDPVRAAQLYLEIIEGQGGDAVEWSNLGMARQLSGDWAGAREAFATALAEAPRHPYLLLNAGDGAWLAGEEEEALRLYGDALAELGEGDLSWDEHLARAQCRAHLGDTRGAISDLQAGLEGAEGTAEAHFVAALVYCLLEDPDNAIVHSELAAQKGMAPRWFSLPWFDPIREDPAFGGARGAAS